MPTIVLFANFQLPEGSANATRVVSLAKLIKTCGYDVLMCGVNDDNCQQLSGSYEGIPYELITFGAKKLNAHKRRDYSKLLKEKIVAWFDDCARTRDIYAVLYSGSRLGLVSFFTDFCSSRGYKMIYNHVEWYDLGCYGGLLAPIKYIRYLYEFHFVYPRFKNIIAISHLISDYCKKRGCHVITIPIIIDTKRYAYSCCSNHNVTVLAYAGTMGRKDDLANVIKAIGLLEEDMRKKLRFVIFGVTQKKLLKRCGWHSWARKLIGREVVCKGVIPHQAVRNELLAADFTILLRKNTKRMNAGFPTKLGESMAAGVPVIANVTSDIGLYLHDGKEGFVCLDNTPEACKRVLLDVLNTSFTKKNEMRINARKRAEQSFDCFSYSKEMMSFLNDII